MGAESRIQDKSLETAAWYSVQWAESVRRRWADSLPFSFDTVSIGDVLYI